MSDESCAGCGAHPAVACLQTSSTRIQPAWHLPAPRPASATGAHLLTHPASTHLTPHTVQRLHCPAARPQAPAERRAPVPAAREPRQPLAQNVFGMPAGRAPPHPRPAGAAVPALQVRLAGRAGAGAAPGRWVVVTPVHLLPILPGLHPPRDPAARRAPTSGYKRTTATQQQRRRRAAWRSPARCAWRWTARR